MGNFLKYQAMTQNSLNLKIGDLVKSDRGCVGKVIDVEYNDCDEAEIDWLDNCKGNMSRRVSQCFLIKILQ